MNDYRVIVFRSNPEWNIVSEAELKNYLWEGDNAYRPKTTVQICGVEGKGIYVRMKSLEQPYKSYYTKRDDPVYRDSCMEFFFQPLDIDERYINFEINPHCVCLSAIGKSRNDRIFLRDITRTKYEISPLHVEGGWGVELFIPQRLLAICYGISFETEMCKSIRTNVYKCAEDSEHPHYQSLFPVDTAEPDFHRPEFFERLYFQTKG